METPDKAIELTSAITCPQCGHAETESMPTDACQWFYGTAPWPPIPQGDGCWE